MTMKLYCFGESGNAYKAALTLTLADAEWEPVFVDFFKGEGRTPEFRALNVMGEVPVLEDGDMILTQSGVIQDYISSKTGKLGGRSAAERREVLRWMFFDNHKVSGVAGPLRFNMNFLPEDKRNADVNAFMKRLFRERSWGDMAESETYAHLEHLRLEGKAEAHRNDQGRLVYDL